MEPLKGHLPLQEAAKKYGVSPRTLNRWCRQKGLGVKSAGFWQVNEVALAAWLAPVGVAECTH
jgi:transposase-like protein